MSVPVTPQKRQSTGSSDVIDTPRMKRIKRRTGAVLPSNTPLNSFPTPPASRHRKVKSVEDEAIEYSDQTEQSVPVQRDYPSLPAHLQNLLKLHHGLNLALSIHIATHPPVLPPHSATTTRIQLSNISNFHAIRRAVENTSRHKFGLPELSRLAWLWTWDGVSLPTESNQSTSADENPFLVKPNNISLECSPHISGLSYLITPTRTLDSSGRRVHTHGIGIELDLQPGETRQVLIGGADGGLGNKGQGGGVRVVGRWSAGGDLREKIVLDRLLRWVELHGGYESDEEIEEEARQLPTPTSRNSARSSIPPIPLLPLPSLQAAHNLSQGISSSSLYLGPTPIPKSDNPLAVPGLDDPFEIKDKPKLATGSVAERLNAMRNRMRANENADNAIRTTLGGAISGGIKSLSVPVQQEELRRRSTLSRLEGIAEGVWQMFSLSPGLSSLPTSPRGRRRAIPLDEATDMLVKSSKTPMSQAEALTSLQMLASLCPFFVTVKTVGSRQWLDMPVTVATTTRIERGMDLAGPASPGHIRRGAGLNEVKEKIRRELENC